MREQLERILAANRFVIARRASQFLRFIVEETLAGEGGSLKESVVAVRVFGRPASFDPRTCSAVRAEASHLRKRLRSYYREEGRADPVLIEMPPRGYVPSFRRVFAPAPAACAGPGRRLVVAALLVALAAGLGLLTYRMRVPGRGSASVALLPFANLDGDAAGDRLASEVGERFAFAFSSMDGLRLVPAASVTAGRAQPNLKSPGRELGVVAFVEGAVGREHGRVRVSARLVDGRTGFQIWSESFAGPPGEVAGFARHVATRVSRLGR